MEITIADLTRVRNISPFVDLVINSRHFSKDELVSFFHWLDTMIRGASSKVRRSQNVEEILKFCPESIANRVRTRNPWITKNTPSVGLDRTPNEVKKIMDELMNKSGHSENDLFEALHGLARLISLGETDPLRVRNARLLAFAISENANFSTDITDQMAERRIEERERRTKVLFGNEPPNNIFDLNKYSIITQEDIEYARANVDFECAALPLHPCYGIEDIDKEIAKENQGSVFERALSARLDKKARFTPFERVVGVGRKPRAIRGEKIEVPLEVIGEAATQRRKPTPFERVIGSKRT